MKTIIKKVGYNVVTHWLGILYNILCALIKVLFFFSKHPRIFAFATYFLVVWFIVLPMFQVLPMTTVTLLGVIALGIWAVRKDYYL